MDQMSASLGCWGLPDHASTRSVYGDSISMFGATATSSRGMTPGVGKVLVACDDATYLFPQQPVQRINLAYYRDRLGGMNWCRKRIALSLPLG